MKIEIENKIAALALILTGLIIIVYCGKEIVIQKSLLSQAINHLEETSRVKR